MIDEEEEEGFRRQWQMRQERYRRLLEEWRTYPAPSEEDPGAEIRDRTAQLERSVPCPSPTSS